MSSGTACVPLQSVLLQNCRPLAVPRGTSHSSACKPAWGGLQQGFAFCCGCGRKKWLCISGKSTVLQHYSLLSFNWEAALRLGSCVLW